MLIYASVIIKVKNYACAQLNHKCNEIFSIAKKKILQTSSQKCLDPPLSRYKLSAIYQYGIVNHSVLDFKYNCFWPKQSVSSSSLEK